MSRGDNAKMHQECRRERLWDRNRISTGVADSTDSSSSLKFFHVPEVGRSIESSSDVVVIGSRRQCPNTIKYQQPNTLIYNILG